MITKDVITAFLLLVAYLLLGRDVSCRQSPAGYCRRLPGVPTLPRTCPLEMFKRDELGRAVIRNLQRKGAELIALALSRAIANVNALAHVRGTPRV
ncbi:hypothetical protein ACFFHJ_10240 [Planotetraspora thailandica]|uniref:hypothetical protein n=1 Tax=Planotetraspora thailandica TaxID=487172 RepID=UPI00194E1635|nr:hypothetical protein [Planotetraspora thailandica]